MGRWKDFRRRKRQEKFGGANRDRTDDLLNAIQALSQLSYGPTPGKEPAPFPAKRSGGGF
jgi:hypothetical protein